MRGRSRAVHALADQVIAEQLKLGMLFPPQSEMLEVAIHTTPRRKRIQWPCPWLLASIKGLGFSVRRCVGVGLGTEAEPRLRSPAARPEGA